VIIAYDGAGDPVFQLWAKKVRPTLAPKQNVDTRKAKSSEVSSMVHSTKYAPPLNPLETDRTGTQQGRQLCL
jgi:hypothetical protein